MLHLAGQTACDCALGGVVLGTVSSRPPSALQSFAGNTAICAGNLHPEALEEEIRFVPLGGSFPCKFHGVHCIPVDSRQHDKKFCA
jgi:hypothetical protein